MSFILIGLGPGIGLAVAKLFAAKKFIKVALLARNQSNLNDAQKEIQSTSSGADVRTYVVDATDLSKLKQVLQQTEKDLGPPECVYFNAAKVALSKLFETSVEDMEGDFKISVLALHETASWAIPLLKKAQNPALLVTNSMLYRTPNTDAFSLSLTKTAQRNMVVMMNMEYGKDVHVGLVSVEGVVSPDGKHMSPQLIAERAWELYSQKKGDWQLEIEIKEV